MDAEAVLNAGAKKEIKYLEPFGRPLLPMDRMRRETFDLEKQLPSVHLDSLQKYMQIAKHLIPQSDPRLLRSVLRHPNLRPGNIFLSDKFEITSLIDWQNSTILPLFLHSRVPNDVDNSSDPVSRALDPPSLPPATDDMEESERLQQLGIFAKRQLHYLYMTETAKRNPLHFEALSHPFTIGRRKSFGLSSAPWEGDNIPLRASLMFAKQNWQAMSADPDIPCPINFAPEEELECLRLDKLEQEADEQLKSSKAMLGLGPEGCVSNERYESVQAAIARIRAMCFDEAESGVERNAIRDHWVFDDMDEDEYL